MVVFLHTDNEDGEEIVENDVLPLSFDSAYSGHVTTSAFPLFRMPVELFTYVMRWLSQRDLKALALVDRDCCKLAALTLFKKVEVYPLSGLSPISGLVSRHGFREVNAIPYTGSPSNFTKCVRQMTICDTVHEVLSGPRSDDDGDLKHMLFRSDYTVSFCQVFSSDFANLHTLHWVGLPFSTSDIFLCVNHPSLKHVLFRGFIVDEDNMELSTPDDDDDERTPTSTLETISLDISWNSNSSNPRSIVFFHKLFQTVQSSVRQITWTGFRGYGTQDSILMSANGFDAPFFPNLRSITLNGIATTDTIRISDVFLNKDHTRIRSLSMGTAVPSSSVFFGTHGYIPSLKHLCLLEHDQAISTYPTEIVNFLEANTQLETLKVEIPTSHSTINDSLLPILRRDFKMLTSLRLTFDIDGLDGPIVDLESSLQGISSLTALRRLWLSAGGSRGNRSWSWKICHRDVAKSLKPLVNLELLAFSQDTYDIPNLHPLAPRNHPSGSYYLSQALSVDVTREISKYLTPEEYRLYMAPQEGPHDTPYDVEVALHQRRQLTQQVWERWHLRCMSEVVNGCYAQSLRGLRWCFVGQLAFSPVCPYTDAMSGGSGFTAEWTRRDPDLTLLRKKMAIDI